MGRCISNLALCFRHLCGLRTTDTQRETQRHHTDNQRCCSFFDYHQFCTSSCDSYEPGDFQCYQAKSLHSLKFRFFYDRFCKETTLRSARKCRQNSRLEVRPIEDRWLRALVFEPINDVLREEQLHTPQQTDKTKTPKIILHIEGSRMFYCTYVEAHDQYSPLQPR